MQSRLTFALLVAVALWALPARAAWRTGELVYNGGAESGATSGWTRHSGATMGRFSTGVSGKVGSWFFYGGGDDAQYYQWVNVWSHADEINNGNAYAEFSARIGGYNNDGDRARVHFDLCTSTSSCPQRRTLDWVSNGDRGGSSKMLYRSSTYCRVPSGTRYIRVWLEFDKIGWFFNVDNDGYLDAISAKLVLAPRAGVNKNLVMGPGAEWGQSLCFWNNENNQLARRTDWISGRAGSWYYYGGTTSYSRAAQWISVNRDWSGINSNQRSIKASALLGGYGNIDDHVTMRVEQWNSARNHRYRSITLDLIKAAQRGWASKFLSVEGGDCTVHSGTRFLKLVLEFRRYAYTVNDGFADQLDVRLVPRIAAKPSFALDRNLVWMGGGEYASWACVWQREAGAPKSLSSPNYGNRRGSQVIGGLEGHAVARAFQWTDVSPDATQIAAGNRAVKLSAWAGGAGSDTDEAKAWVEVWSSGKTTKLQTVSLPPITPAARNGATALLFNEDGACVLPTGARWLRIYFEVKRNSGTPNDGAIDEISVSVVPSRNAPAFPGLGANLAWAANFEGTEGHPWSCQWAREQSFPRRSSDAVSGKQGSTFLSGETPSDMLLHQWVDVSSEATWIDRGKRQLRTSAWLGASGGNHDRAVVMALAYDASKATVLQTSGDLTVTVADRGSATKLMHRQDTMPCALPSGTRWLKLYMKVYSAGSGWNDAYVDDVRMMLVAAPTALDTNLVLAHGAEHALWRCAWVMESNTMERRDTTVAGPEGRYYYYGGSTAAARAAQWIDVTHDATAIAAGQRSLTASAFLGGYGSIDDFVTVRVEQWDRARTTRHRHVELDVIKAAQRGSATKFLHVEGGDCVVHSGTRHLKVVLAFQRFNPTISDGYVDSIDVRLVPRIPAKPTYALNSNLVWMGGGEYASWACVWERDVGAPATVTRPFVDRHGAATIGALPGHPLVRTFQWVDVSADAAAIAAGSRALRVAALVGGVGTEADTAVVSVEAWSAGKATMLGSAAVAAVAPAQRNNEARLMPEEDGLCTLPAATRWVKVVLESRRAVGVTADGALDAVDVRVVASRPAAAPLLLESNVLRNGGGESAPWTCEWSPAAGSPRVERITAAAAGREGGGMLAAFSRFVTGTAEVTQWVDVSSMGAHIDASFRAVTVSGMLGGAGAAATPASVEVTPFDAAKAAPVGAPTTIGPVSVADRGTAAAVVAQRNHSLIPVGARHLRVRLLIGSGAFGSTFVDGLSLFLNHSDVTYTATPSVSPTLTNTTPVSFTASFPLTPTPESTGTLTVVASPTPSAAWTATASRQVTPSRLSSTGTLTATLSMTATNAPSGTVSLPPSLTQSPIDTRTGTLTITTTSTAARSSTGTLAMTSTATTTATHTTEDTSTGTLAASFTQSATPTTMPSMTASLVHTGTSTLVLTDTRTALGTLTLALSRTASVAGTASRTAVDTATGTLAMTVSQTASSSKTASSTGTMQLTASRTDAVSSSGTLQLTSTVSPTLSASHITPSASKTAMETSTGTLQLSLSQTPTVSSTASATTSLSPTLQPSVTVSSSGSTTASPSGSRSVSLAPSLTQTVAATLTQSLSATSTLEMSLSVSPVLSPTATLALTASRTTALTVSGTLQLTATPSATVTPFLTATSTGTAVNTASGTLHLSWSQTAAVSSTASATASLSPTLQPSVTVSSSGSTTASPSGSRSVSLAPSLTGTVAATLTQSLSATSTLEMSLSVSPVLSPTSTLMLTASRTTALTVSGTLQMTTTPSATVTPFLTATTTGTAADTASGTLKLSWSQSRIVSTTESATATPTPTPERSATVSSSTSLTSTVSLSRSETVAPSPTRTVAATLSASLSPTSTLEISLSSSTVLSSTRTALVTLSCTVPPTATKTASATLHASFSPSFAASRTQSLETSATVSRSATVLRSQSESLSLTPPGAPTVSSTATSLHSASVSIVASSSRTVPDPATATLDPSGTVPLVHSATLNETSSDSVFPATTGSSKVSATASMTATEGRSATLTSTGTATRAVVAEENRTGSASVPGTTTPSHLPTATILPTASLALSTTKAPTATPEMPVFAPPVTDAPPPDEAAAVHPFVAVFGLTGACSGQLNFLPLLVLAFASVVVARIAYTAIVRRYRDDSPDSYETVHVPRWKSLVRQHAWVGLVWPCHHYCGPDHAAIAAVKLLALICASAAFTNQFAALLEADPLGSTLVIGALAAVVAVALQPPLTALFAWYTLLDRRQELHVAAGPSHRYVPSDLQQFGVKRPLSVGLSDTTIAAFELLQVQRGRRQSTSASTASTLIPKDAAEDHGGENNIGGGGLRCVIGAPERNSFFAPAADEASDDDDMLPGDLPEFDPCDSDVSCSERAPSSGADSNSSHFLDDGDAAGGGRRHQKSQRLESLALVVNVEDYVAELHEDDLAIEEAVMNADAYVNSTLDLGDLGDLGGSSDEDVLPARFHQRRPPRCAPRSQRTAAARPDLKGSLPRRRSSCAGSDLSRAGSAVSLGDDASPTRWHRGSSVGGQAAPDPSDAAVLRSSFRSAGTVGLSSNGGSFGRGSFGPRPSSVGETSDAEEKSSLVRSSSPVSEAPARSNTVSAKQPHPPADPSSDSLSDIVDDRGVEAPPARAPSTSSTSPGSLPADAPARPLKRSPGSAVVSFTGSLAAPEAPRSADATSSPRDDTTTPMQFEGFDTVVAGGFFGVSSGAARPPSRLPSGVKRRDPRTCVVVERRAYHVAAWATALAMAAVLVGLIYAAGAFHWCGGTRRRLFWRVVAVSCAVDAAVLQLLYIGLVALFRWVTADTTARSSGAGDDNGSDAARAPQHELHPIHGQWRHVGLLSHAHMHEGSAAACPTLKHSFAATTYPEQRSFTALAAKPSSRSFAYAPRDRQATADRVAHLRNTVPFRNFSFAQADESSAGFAD